jgi:hypothetical protein
MYQRPVAPKALRDVPVEHVTLARNLWVLVTKRLFAGFNGAPQDQSIPTHGAEFVELKMMQASPLVSPMFSVGCEGAGDVHEMVFLSKSKIWQTI